MQTLRSIATKNGRPLFLIDDEDDPGKVFETDHILQKLYDQVELKEIFQKCL